MAFYPVFTGTVRGDVRDYAITIRRDLATDPGAPSTLTFRRALAIEYGSPSGTGSVGAVLESAVEFDVPDANGALRAMLQACTANTDATVSIESLDTGGTPSGSVAWRGFIALGTIDEAVYPGVTGKGVRFRAYCGLRDRERFPWQFAFTSGAFTFHSLLGRPLFAHTQLPIAYALDVQPANWRGLDDTDDGAGMWLDETTGTVPGVAPHTLFEAAVTMLGARAFLGIDGRWNVRALRLDGATVPGAPGVAAFDGTTLARAGQSRAAFTLTGGLVRADAYLTRGHPRSSADVTVRFPKPTTGATPTSGLLRNGTFELWTWGEPAVVPVAWEVRSGLVSVFTPGPTSANAAQISPDGAGRWGMRQALRLVKYGEPVRVSVAFAARQVTTGSADVRWRWAVYADEADASPVQSGSWVPGGLSDPLWAGITGLIEKSDMASGLLYLELQALNADVAVDAVTVLAEEPGGTTPDAEMTGRFNAAGSSPGFTPLPSADVAVEMPLHEGVSGSTPMLTTLSALATFADPFPATWPVSGWTDSVRTHALASVLAARQALAQSASYLDATFDGLCPPGVSVDVEGVTYIVGAGVALDLVAERTRGVFVPRPA